MRIILSTKSRLASLPFVSRFVRDDDGVTAIEFAVVAPILLLLILGIFEFSMVMFATSTLEGAVGASARAGKTGYTVTGQTREEYILSITKSRVSAIMDADKLVIENKIYGLFNQIDAPEPLTYDSNGNGLWNAGDTYVDINGNGQWDSDMAGAGLGGAGDVVVYTVTYPWEIMTPFLRGIIGDENGIFTLRSKVVIRNEPYDDVDLGL